MVILLGVIVLCGLIALFWLMPDLIYKSELRKLEKFYAQFQKGGILEYYELQNHGKFRKEVLLLSYEILDRDGRYLWCRCLQDGHESEIDIRLDVLYQDKLVLRAPNGVVLKTFQFEI